jgi:DNA-binding protein HU-beta
MTKEIVKSDEYINVMAKNSGITKIQAKKALDAFYDLIFESLKDKKIIRVPKIGTLSVVRKKATTYRNPKTKQTVQQGETDRVKFSTSNVIKEELKAEK